ncbi:hypothetical protein LR48_Vigan03g079200 [Vigna angularis]|uniref:Uncharacterized protein n=1 Tax=Phaseolus angularis TaxID=3914 RepID=A0A0L9U3P2_PHAAN|nr:hypothetical protein LR48_Vigan03g079200 [Vigna angularis]
MGHYRRNLTFASWFTQGSHLRHSVDHSKNVLRVIFSKGIGRWLPVFACVSCRSSPLTLSLGRKSGAGCWSSPPSIVLQPQRQVVNRHCSSIVPLQTCISLNFTSGLRTPARDTSLAR